MRRALDRTGATIRLWYLSAYGLVKSETFVGFVQLFPSRFPWQEQTCGDQKPNNTKRCNGHIAIEKNEKTNNSSHNRFPPPLVAAREIAKSCHFINASERQHQIREDSYPSFFLYRRIARLSSTSVN
jgi:hypothetical protein